MRVALMLVLASCLQACSYAFVQAPPPHPEEVERVECTSSRIAPIADVYGAVQLAGIALAAEVMSSVSVTGHGDPPGVTPEMRAVQVGAIGLAIVEVASSAYGFRKTAACERAEERWELHHSLPKPTEACTRDDECKAGRRCVAGACAWPTP